MSNKDVTNKLSDVVRHYVMKQLAGEDLESQISQIDDEVKELANKRDKLRRKVLALENERGKLICEMQAMKLKMPVLVHISSCNASGTYILTPFKLDSGNYWFNATRMPAMTIEEYEETFMNFVPF